MQSKLDASQASQRMLEKVSCLIDYRFLHILFWRCLWTEPCRRACCQCGGAPPRGSGIAWCHLTAWCCKHATEQTTRGACMIAMLVMLYCVEHFCHCDVFAWYERCASLNVCHNRCENLRRTLLHLNVNHLQRHLESRNFIVQYNEGVSILVGLTCCCHISYHSVSSTAVTVMTWTLSRPWSLTH